MELLTTSLTHADMYTTFTYTAKIHIFAIGAYTLCIWIS